MELWKAYTHEASRIFDDGKNANAWMETSLRAQGRMDGCEILRDWHRVYRCNGETTGVVEPVLFPGAARKRGISTSNIAGLLTAKGGLFSDQDVGDYDDDGGPGRDRPEWSDTHPGQVYG